FLPLVFLLQHWHGDGWHAGPTPYAWVQPMQGAHSVYSTYSLILATFLGAMGLPHVVVRFYTNRDGRATRQTTVTVLALLGLFYLLPTLYGVLGRRYLPGLITSGHTDSVVLELPGHVLGGAGGDLLTALLGAGAFAAFLSTTSGLVISVGGVIAQDLAGPKLRPVTAFRTSAAVATAVTYVLAVAATGLAVAHAVELAFAVAASTLCPLLVLGIWWRGLTTIGAITGMAVGGITSGAAVLIVMLGGTPTGWWGAIVNQPALVTAPLAFVTMILVSRATADRRPPHVARTMVRLHTPEEIELDRGSYHPEHRSSL
ncbi:MAG TPA: cation acetate symporter, partial [Marmoricola sp.]